MDNDSSIFPEVNNPLLKKYAKRILRARVLTFIYSALLLGAGFAFVLTPPTVAADYLLPIEIFSFSLCALFLVLGLVSIKWPFVPLLIAAILMGLFAILQLSAVSTKVGVDASDVVPLIVQVIFTFFIARGTYFASKRKQVAGLIE